MKSISTGSPTTGQYPDWEGTMATLEYEGYIARIETDEENNGFHGRVINIGDVVNSKGRSIG